MHAAHWGRKFGSRELAPRLGDLVVRFVLMGVNLSALVQVFDRRSQPRQEGNPRSMLSKAALAVSTDYESEHEVFDLAVRGERGRDFGGLRFE
jgi:hypothetical protein